jgi:hypothetical protein
MKKLFFLLASMFLLAGCIESVAVFGGGAANGKMVQSSFQSGASYAIKKKTGKTPLSHALHYAKKKNKKIKNSCSSFNNKKDLEICLLVKKRIIFSKTRIKEKEFSDQHSNQPISSLRSSINKKSKIKYLD